MGSVGTVSTRIVHCAFCGAKDMTIWLTKGLHELGVLDVHGLYVLSGSTSISDIAE